MTNATWIRRALPPIAVALLLAAAPTGAAESPVGRWKTVDEKTGKVRSRVEIYEQDGKLFGKIVGLTEPVYEDGTPKRCRKCAGADKDQPVVGLVIIRNLVPGDGSYEGGTILDPENGKVYKAEIWVEDGTLKVRGYIGFFYRTQTWMRDA